MEPKRREFHYRVGSLVVHVSPAGNILHKFSLRVLSPVAILLKKDFVKFIF